MKIFVVKSGSKGNATLIYDEGRLLLIDMGVAQKDLKEALRSFGKDLIDIEAMLLTHEHSDHTKGIQYLNPLTIYCTEETYDAPNVEPIKPYENFKIGHLEITPVSTSHDVKNPLGFVIKNKEEKLVYLTDSGKIPSKTLTKLKNADYYVFESNHDVEMLMNTNRPYILKRRILSDKGHLSNKQSAEYLSKLIGPKTKQIIFAHLSEEANSPSVCIDTHRKIYKEKGISLQNIRLECANQHYMVIGGKEWITKNLKITQKS